eukprot:501305-Hanusia_phi.AAC.1
MLYVVSQTSKEHNINSNIMLAHQKEFRPSHGFPRASASQYRMWCKNLMVPPRLELGIFRV